MENALRVRGGAWKLEVRARVGAFALLELLRLCVQILTKTSYRRWIAGAGILRTDANAS